MFSGTSLAAQWLRLRSLNAGGAGLIPGWGTNIPHAAWSGKKKKRKKKIYFQLENEQKLQISGEGRLRPPDVLGCIV